jgi:hypothetical protein
MLQRRSAMCFDVRGVDHLHLRGSSFPRQLPEQVLPHPAPSPSHEAIIDRRWRAILRWAITPSAAAVEHMDDPTDHTPIVDPTPFKTNQLVLNQDRIVCAQEFMNSDPSLLSGAKFGNFDVCSESARKRKTASSCGIEVDAGLCWSALSDTAKDVRSARGGEGHDVNGDIRGHTREDAHVTSDSEPRSNSPVTGNLFTSFWRARRVCSRIIHKNESGCCVGG